MPKILIASRNQGKLREVKALFRGSGFRFTDLSAFPHLPEIPEDGDTFIANASQKALCASTATGLISIADDSGLEVNALDGAPGVRSARFAPTDDQRIEKLLNLLQDLPLKDRGARFRCAICVADPEKIIGTVQGSCSGRITREPMGKGGFGYDPIFYIPSLKKTFAQISEEEKNLISHRGKALRKVPALLKRAF